MASDKVLITFNPKLPVILETDASPYGLAAVMSHKIEGQMRPIGFISRTLTTAEQKYSHLDKEATAIFWATKKLFQYLYGREFTLITDSKPLKTIFDPDKNLPAITALRLTRYVLWLQQFKYKIIYRAGKLNTIADCFSRQPLIKTEPNKIDETFRICDYTINTLSLAEQTITYKDLRVETSKDEALQELIKEIQLPNSDKVEYSLHQGILMQGQRVVIPRTLQTYVLKQLLATHSGIVKMKAIARSIVYWKNIDQDIENVARSCKACASIQSNASKVPVHPWERATEVWQRIHIDYAGPIDGKQFLIIMDAYSKWLEVEIFTKAPTTVTLIETLKKIFARQGFPYILVSDNQSIFKSYNFSSFLHALGIAHRTTSPYSPSTNGQAERAVQIFKQKLYAMKFERATDINDMVRAITFQYNTTPLATDKSPAELHLGRQLRTQLPLLRPFETDKTKLLKAKSITIRTLRVGDRVLSRNYVGPNKWKTGIIIEKLGHLIYNVKLDNGYTIKRHINQLKRCNIIQIEEEIHNDTNAKPTKNNETNQKQVTFNFPINVRTYDPTQNIQPRRNVQPSQIAQQSPNIQPPTNGPTINSEREERPDARRSTRVRRPVVRLDL